MSYYNEKSAELRELLFELKSSSATFDELFARFEKERETIEQMAKERQIGFPVLAKAYEDFFELQDKQLIDFLQYKKNPAISASELVKEYARQRRTSDKSRKIAEYLVEYYESICPFLIDLKEEVPDITEEDRANFAEYTEEEREDSVTNFISKDEYRKLNVSERNQIALDRYWKRPKTKWQIGAMYERYIGYKYETSGYEVNYHGLLKGLEDLGRDIIASKGKELIVIQCKNWSKFRTIYEKHIFQFFGTVFQYTDENPDKKVRAIFYTSTVLSPLARRFAKALKIELQEETKMNKEYPCIKCNISQVDGTKIYHLPFDQQYDKVKVEPHKGEFYCSTVKEAEDAGFRRAFRYKGLKQK